MSDNPFESLRVNPYVKTYVGSPIEELRSTLGTLQTRHDTSLATMDQLARAYGNIKAVEGDQPYLDSYGQQLRKDIEEYSKAPEHATAGIMSMARDFAINPQLRSVQQTYKNYMADVADAREKAVSPFQEQKIKESLNRYTQAGGAEDLQVFKQTPFYEELDMQGLADKSVAGINTEIEKGVFDENGNLAGAYYEDEKGNRVQVKRTDTSPERVAFIAASRLLQDPQTRRELLDRYRYNQGKNPQTPQDLQNWVEAKYVQPVVEKYAGIDTSFSVSGNKGGSGSGNGNSVYSDFIFESNQPSYIVKEPFDVEKFETFRASGPYVFELDQKLEKGGESNAETYEIFNERQAMTETIRKGFEKGRGTDLNAEQLSVLEQFTDEEIRGLFYQDRDESGEAQNIIDIVRNGYEENPGEDYKKQIKNLLTNTQVTGSHRGISVGPQEDENISPALLSYFMDMLEYSDTPEGFFDTIENPSNYPITASTGLQYDWDEVGRMLKSDRFNLGEEQAQEMQDALKSYTGKSLFQQNLEDYITDEGIADISMSPQYVPASSVFVEIAKNGNITPDKTALDQASMLLANMMLPQGGGNMRSGIIQVVDPKDGKLKDWKDVYDNLSEREFFQWDKLELTQVGSTNAPGMFEVTIPFSSNRKDGVKQAVFQMALPDNSMFNLSKGIAENVQNRLDSEGSNVDNALLPVYISHSFPSITKQTSASALRNKNSTSDSLERLSFPGITQMETLLNVEKIVPQRNDSGRFYFEDEDENNILNEEFRTVELAVNGLIRRYWQLNADKNAE